jgi:signal peptidase I
MSEPQTPPENPLEPSAAAPDAASAGEPATPRRTRWQYLWHEWLKPFLFVLVAVFSVRSAVADWNDVPTGSMRPTILEGERIFVDKIAYDLRIPFTRVRLFEWGEPQRGDVVVFFSPVDGKRLVKRVVGVPGDRLAMAKGRLYINGAPIEYQPLGKSDRVELGLQGAIKPAESLEWEQLGTHEHPVTLLEARPSMRTFAPLEVPPHSYFMMGDNRDNSHDSRWIGFIDRSAIVGRATAVVISLDPAHYMAPRWHRFFHTLP